MIAVIRVRGTVNTNPDVQFTLGMLRISKPNHMVLVPESRIKMVEKSKDYVTYGEIREDVLARVLEKRGRLSANRRLTPDVLKEKKIAGYSELAKMMIEGKANLKELGIEPLFRLHPPRKGYDRKGIKQPYTLGGALGNRKEKINDLILRMI